MSHSLLIVDDSKLARMVVSSLVARLRPDWTLHEATNAEEALAAIRAGGIDVALIDFNMPGANGLALAADLREIAPDLPIAIVSANIQDEIVAGARKLGAAFLAKPLSEEDMAGFLSGTALRLRRGAR